MKYSLLQNFNKKTDFYHKPFPHIIIKDALPNKIYEELLKNYPSPLDLNVNNLFNNKRYSYPSALVENNNKIHKCWKDFINYHTSRNFYNEVIKVFGNEIIRHHGKFFSSLKKILALDVKKRFLSDNQNINSICLDAQLSCNTPVWFPNSVRKAHIDSGEKLFSGLYYLRNTNDHSKGGDLLIYKVKDEHLNDKHIFSESYVDRKKCDVIKKIPYSGNILVLFINTPISIHGVSPRSITKSNRIFINLVGALPFNLYNIKKANLLKKIFRSLFF